MGEQVSNTIAVDFVVFQPSANIAAQITNI